MTPERQRIAIAEWCGWTCQNQWWSHPTLPCNGGAEIDPPDYLNDLNAMHEAEARLLEHSQNQPTDIEWRMYQVQLERRAGVCLSVHATAAQRAEALLRTIGKWEY